MLFKAGQEELLQLGWDRVTLTHAEQFFHTKNSKCLFARCLCLSSPVMILQLIFRCTEGSRHMNWKNMPGLEGIVQSVQPLCLCTCTTLWQEGEKMERRGDAARKRVPHSSPSGEIEGEIIWGVSKCNITPFTLMFKPSPAPRCLSWEAEN